MARERLKLEQASAVLQVQPKELQNLVQFSELLSQSGRRGRIFST